MESNDVTRGFGDTTRISQGFLPGQSIGGRYQVISILGKGGMGVVYRVNQIFLNKEFALKTIEKHFMSEIVIRRFQQEARTAFALDHPNIITVNDFGVLDDSTPFLVMELIKGETLGERLKRTGCLTVAEAIPIFVQVCFGLAYAHEHGIVHRDIKPNNIMLLNGLPSGAEGSVKIVDFGIAKFTEHEGGEIQALTRTGEIFGSPLYMSPEQCSGARVDHRADVYSLGCVFYEALTGAPPCVGENAITTMMKHQSEPVISLKQASLGADFPQAIEDIVATMLAKSPDRRYQNLGDVAHDLGALRRGDSISAAAKSSRAAEQVRSKATTISMSSTKFYALLLGIAVLSAAIGWASSYMSHRREQEPPQTESFSQKEYVSPFPPMSHDPGSEVDIPVISMEELKEKLNEKPKKELGHPIQANSFQLKLKKLSDEAFELIAANTWIHSLSLISCDISNNSLGRLAKLHLYSISFWGSTFNDVGAEQLLKCQGLVEINALTTHLSDVGVSKLVTIKGLKNLSIAGPGITDKSLIQVAKAKELIYLDLRDTKQLTDEGLSALERTHLSFLNLQNTPIGDAAMIHIAKISTLKTVVLTNTKVTIDGIKELCKNKSMEVDVAKCPNLGPTELRQLRPLFPAIKFVDHQN
jgi:serine/threonine protein kinase